MHQEIQLCVTGLVVAVIDSGVNPIPGRVIEGVNLTSQGAGACTLDRRGHGSAVSATILSIVPAARIVPIRVMDQYGALESPDLLDAAFEWVREHAARLGIGVVCAAFGDTSHSQSDEPWRGSALQRTLAALRTAGIPVAGAAGNWYPEHRSRESQGMAWPAILREIVSAGDLERTPEGMRLSRSTQRLHASYGSGCATTLFVEPGPPGETSGAAAIVAGRLARLRMSDPEAGVDALVARLRAGGSTIADGGLEWPAGLHDEQLLKA